jgi:hypothetical protein
MQVFMLSFRCFLKMVKVLLSEDCLLECSAAGTDRSFGAAYCRNGATSQKTAAFIIVAVRTSKPHRLVIWHPPPPIQVKISLKCSCSNEHRVDLHRYSHKKQFVSLRKPAYFFARKTKQTFRIFLKDAVLEDFLFKNAVPLSMPFDQCCCFNSETNTVTSVAVKTDWSI